MCKRRLTPDYPALKIQSATNGSICLPGQTSPDWPSRLALHQNESISYSSAIPFELFERKQRRYLIACLFKNRGVFAMAEHHMHCKYLVLPVLHDT